MVKRNILMGCLVILFATWSCGYVGSSTSNVSPSEETKLSKFEVVEIHFQEGFENDTVIVLGESKILYKEIITTDAQSGFAGLCELQWNTEIDYLIIVSSDTLKLPTTPKSEYIRVTYSLPTKIAIEWFSKPFIYD